MPSRTATASASSACCGPTTTPTSRRTGRIRGGPSTPRSPMSPLTNATPSWPATPSGSSPHSRRSRSKGSVSRTGRANPSEMQPLHRDYLGMKGSARPPGPTQFSSIPYAFSVKLKNRGANADSPKPFAALRLVWHDYPGEWFEQDVSGEGPAEGGDVQVSAGSDVAFLLVDGQRLLDNAGEEERYL